MKFKIFLLVIFLIIGFSLSANEQIEKPVHEVPERISVLYQSQMAWILCIDGYKWVVTGVGIQQAFRIDNKGNSVPARCDE